MNDVLILQDSTAFQLICFKKNKANCSSLGSAFTAGKKEKEKTQTNEKPNNQK